MSPSSEITKALDRLKQLGIEREKMLHDLTERVKELQCLYKLGSIIEGQEDLEDIFRGFIDNIPPAWQYPNITCARITFQEQEYKTPNFQETKWKQSAPIIAGGDTVGTVEVYYLEERSVADEGPFLKEERTLLDHIAERMGRVIERTWAQEALQVTFEERENYEKVAKECLEGIIFEPSGSLRSLTALNITPEVRRTKAEKDRVLHDLTERVKELQCLYSLETIIEKNEDLDEILNEFVNQLPAAYQYPEVTCARIQINDQDYKTANFLETEWVQASPIIAGGDKVGSIQIYYLEEKPSEDEGPFLKEERALINGVASRIGLLVERIWAQEALQVTTDEREELQSIINQGPAVVFLWDIASGWPVHFVTGNTHQLGLDPNDFYAGRVTFMDYIHQEDRERVLATVTGHSWDTQNILVQEYRIVNSSGEICWVEDRRWVRRNENGKITHYQGILVNINDRKRGCS